MLYDNLVFADPATRMTTTATATAVDMAFVVAPGLRAGLWASSVRRVCSQRRNICATVTTPDKSHLTNFNPVSHDRAVPSNRKSQHERFSEQTAREIFERTCAHANVSSEAALKIETLCKHLVRAGATTNLTGVRTFESSLVVHAVDSLSLLPNLDRVTVDDDDALQVADIGSGAGFPGLPIAAARERWQVSMVEATRKKINYQHDAVGDLDVRNAIPVWGRAELLGEDHRERYDACVARAVARMAALAEISLPWVRVGGYFIAQKSLDVSRRELTEAANALRKLGGEIVDVRQAWTEAIIREVMGERGEEAVVDDGREKCIIVVRKIAETPYMYPRNFNAIKNKPL